MKRITFIPFGILLAILLYACTNEAGDTVIATAAMPVDFKSLNSPAANKANQYDYTGQNYKDLLIAYKSNNYEPTDFDEIDTIVRALTNNPIAPESVTTKQALLSSCLSDPQLALNQLLLASDLSNEAETIVAGLIDSFETLSAFTFNEAYNEIETIESDVSNSLTMSDNDKRVILTVASITRYSLYHSCCEDTDWGKSVGNIVAATAGALESNARAVEYSLITSIAGFEKIKI